MAVVHRRIVLADGIVGALSLPDIGRHYRISAGPGPNGHAGRSGSCLAALVSSPEELASFQKTGRERGFRIIEKTRSRLIE
jgi:hypothetical protein